MVKPNSCSTNYLLIQSVNLYDYINCYEMIMKYVGRLCFDSCLKQKRIQTKTSKSRRKQKLLLKEVRRFQLLHSASV